MHTHSYIFFIFFFNDTATTEIYTLSLHDALPISTTLPVVSGSPATGAGTTSPSTPWAIDCSSRTRTASSWSTPTRSEEHTSELQSRLHLVCRLLLEKKKKFIRYPPCSLDSIY